jgi:hypothetical protein
MHSYIKYTEPYVLNVFFASLYTSLVFMLIYWKYRSVGLYNHCCKAHYGNYPTLHSNKLCPCIPLNVNKIETFYNDAELNYVYILYYLSALPFLYDELFL